MVVLLDGVGDAGKHAVDPTAIGVSGGYLLGDTQVDEYPAPGNALTCRNPVVPMSERTHTRGSTFPQASGFGSRVGMRLRRAVHEPRTWRTAHGSPNAVANPLVALRSSEARSTWE